MISEILTNSNVIEIVSNLDTIQTASKQISIDGFTIAGGVVLAGAVYGVYKAISKLIKK